MCGARASVPATWQYGPKREERGSAMLRDRFLLTLAIAVGMLVLPGRAQCPTHSPDVETQIDISPDYLGFAVDAEGDRVVVSDPFQAFPNNGHAGAVFVIERVAGEWTRTATIPGPYFHYKLGTHLALDGDRLLVGAGNSVIGANNAARLYERDPDGAWNLSASFVDSQAPRALALQGTTAVFVYPLSGLAIHEEGPEGWTQTQILSLPTSSTALPSLSMHGDRMVVGFPFASESSYQSGRAFVYRRVSGQWAFEAELERPDPGYQDRFGAAVAIHDGRVIVGAPLTVTAGFHSGSAHLFELIGGSWVRTQVLGFPGPAVERHFGCGVALRGDFAAVTWVAHPDATGPAGGVRTFRNTAGTWLLQGGFDSAGGISGSSFGHEDGRFPSVALAEGLVVLGVPMEDGNPGATMGQYYIAPSSLERATGFCGCLQGPCGNAGGPGAGCANSTGAGAELRPCGSTRVAWDDLELRGVGLRPFTPAMLAMGTGGPAQPFGAGQLCLVGASGIFRFPVQSADASGSLAYGPGLVGHSQSFAPPGRIAAGDTRSFQVWYRDPTGPCGASFNLTSAQAIEFAP
jgi:hypothetical protein